MNKRFFFDLSIGILGLIAVIIFGNAGLSVLALFVFYPLFKKKKPDERELQLFYKTGNITAALTLAAAVVIWYLSGKTVNGHLIGDNWLPLIAFSFLLVHGISGIIIFKRG